MIALVFLVVSFGFVSQEQKTAVPSRIFRESRIPAGSLRMAACSTKPTQNTVVDIYPHYTPLADLQSKYKHTKYLHLIRHAQGTHNVQNDRHSIENMDARLTDKGISQCRILASSIDKEHSYLWDTELVVSSPLTRCVQTTLLSLGPILKQKQDLPVLASELVRETVNFHCDRRRTIAEISADHPELDFSHIEHDHDPIWQHYEERLGGNANAEMHRESAEVYKVADRGRSFFQWLAQRPEQRVVVCSHAAFLNCLLNFGHSDHFMEPQELDDRDDKEYLPVVRYNMQDEMATQLREEFSNCELRSMIVAFA